MNSAKEIWRSLYSYELERIWKSERESQRKLAMLHYVLNHELQKLQESLDNEMKQIEHQILSMEESKSNESRENVAMAALSDSELDKSPPLTQRFNFIPTCESISNQSILYNLLSTDCEILKTTSKDASANETFSDIKKETSTTSKKDVEDIFQGYDIFPIARPRSPLFVRKTEPVLPRKVDHIQLPEWSCEDCRKLYDNSNLPPGELRRKLTVCSKHSKKLEPRNETIKASFPGDWDVEMFLSQEDN